MLLSAQARGWSLFYMEQQDLYQHMGEARARMRPLKVFNDPECWFELGDELDEPLAHLNVILMRIDLHLIMNSYTAPICWSKQRPRVA